MIVRLFQTRFAQRVMTGRKLQTVRPVPNRPQDMPRAGQVISLRCWSGLPYRSKQIVLRESVITEVQRVRVTDDGVVVCVSETRAPFESSTWHGVDAKAFAQADGFRNYEDMAEWFREAHGLPFEGILIKWGAQNA